MLIECACTGDFLEKAISIALYKLTQTPDLSSVKDILRYQVYYEKKHPQPPLYDPLVEDVNVYLQYLYLTLQEISSAIQTSHFKPILGRSIDLGIFQEYKKTGQQYLPGKTNKKIWLEDLDAIINRKMMYAIIGMRNHAVTITGMTSSELIIKDSRKNMPVKNIFMMPAGIETPVIRTEKPQIFKLDIAKLTAYKNYNDPVLTEQQANICIMYLDAEVDSSKPLQRKIDRMSSRSFNSRASMAELVKEQMELTKITIQDQQSQQEDQEDQVDWDYITTPRDEHQLKAVKLPNSNHTCDGCKKKFKKNDWSYRCNMCDIDLCVKCALIEVKEVGKPGYYNKGEGKRRRRTLLANKVKSQNSQTRRKKEKSKKSKKRVKREKKRKE